MSTPEVILAGIEISGATTATDVSASNVKSAIKNWAISQWPLNTIDKVYGPWADEKAELFRYFIALNNSSNQITKADVEAKLNALDALDESIPDVGIVKAYKDGGTTQVFEYATLIAYDETKQILETLGELGGLLTTCRTHEQVQHVTNLINRLKGVYVAKLDANPTSSTSELKTQLNTSTDAKKTLRLMQTPIIMEAVLPRLNEEEKKLKSAIDELQTIFQAGTGGAAEELEARKNLIDVLKQNPELQYTHFGQCVRDLGAVDDIEKVLACGGRSTTTTTEIKIDPIPVAERATLQDPALQRLYDTIAGIESKQQQQTALQPVTLPPVQGNLGDLKDPELRRIAQTLAELQIKSAGLQGAGQQVTSDTVKNLDKSLDDILKMLMKLKAK